jgi:hypothetical protein
MRCGSRAKLLKYGSYKMEKSDDSLIGPRQSYLVNELDKFRMLVCDMFLDKRRGFEEFLTSFAPELALIFLLDVGFYGLGQLPDEKCHLTYRWNESTNALVDAFTTIVAWVNAVPVNQQCDFGIEPFQPTLV